MMLTLLFDVAPAAAPFGLAIGVGFFLVLAAAAYVAFRLLRKTLKFAFRLAIVAVILLVAVIGTVSIFWLSSGGTPHPRLPPARSR